MSNGTDTGHESQRWYLGFRTSGIPDQFLEEIRSYIYREDLAQYIPLIRIERQSRRVGREFYFFIAIESEKPGKVPKIIEDKLLRLKWFKSREKKCFSLAEIGKMVGKSEYSITSFNRTINYQPAEQYKAPQFLWDKQEYSLPSATQESSDQLLIWLSAKTQGSWSQFCQVTELMKLSNRILRCLKLLGHLEVSPDGKKWSIAPPVACQKADHYLICGQRIPAWLEQIRDASIKVEKLTQPNGTAPSCMRLMTTDPELVKEIGWIPVPDVARQLTELLPDFTGWKDQLTVLSGIVPSLLKWKHFNGQDFVECGIPCETGFYEMYNQDGQKLQSLWYDAESDLWRQGDWYGLRFAALQELSGILIASYNPTQQILGIPVGQRWPEIYERALVLSSGLLPVLRDGWLLYRDVLAENAQRLCEKLQVRLEISHA